MIEKIPKPKTASEIMFEQCCNEAYKLAALSADMPIETAEKVLENYPRLVSEPRSLTIPDVLQVHIKKDRLWFTINDEPTEHELKCSWLVSDDEGHTYVFDGFLPKSIFTC